MRTIGLVLMGFGIWCILVGVTGVLEPTLQAMGVDVHAVTTSLVGTSVIGALSLLAGALLRRRGTEAAERRAAAASAAAAPAPAELPARVDAPAFGAAPGAKAPARPEGGSR